MKTQETKEVKQEVKNYLVTGNGGGSSWWVDETKFVNEKDLPQTTWKPELKDGEPVFSVVSSKTVKLAHLRSADGATDTWVRVSDLEENIQRGWKPVMIEAVREDQSNGKQK